MKDKINKMIPAALNALKESGIADNDNNVPKEFKGYISSMGASIIQTGLLATIAFYGNDENKKADSSKLLDAILRLLKGEDYNLGDKLIGYVIEQTKKDNVRTTEIKVAEDLDTTKLQLVEEEINDALIALKLALRTYKMSK